MVRHQKSVTATAVAEAITKAGSQQALADSLGVWQSAISKWANGQSRPSPGNAKAIEQLLGVPRSRLRPDLWG